jgi:hypothetical protein
MSVPTNHSGLGPHRAGIADDVRYSLDRVPNA